MESNKSLIQLIRLFFDNLRQAKGQLVGVGGGGVVAGPNWQPWAGPKAAAASDRVRKIVIDGRKKDSKKFCL